MKYTVKTITKNAKTMPDGKPIYNMVLIGQDTKDYVGSGFDVSYETLKQGDEIEAELKPGKLYNGTQQYYVNPPKQQSGNSSKFPVKDYNFLKREAALKAAVEYSAHQNIVPKELAQIIKIAEEFYKFLNQ